MDKRNVKIQLLMWWQSRDQYRYLDPEDPGAKFWIQVWFETSADPKHLETVFSLPERRARSRAALTASILWRTLRSRPGPARTSCHAKVFRCNAVTLRSRPAGITAFFLRSRPGTAKTSCHGKVFRINAVTLRSRPAGITAWFLRSRPAGITV